LDWDKSKFLGRACTPYIPVSHTTAAYMKKIKDGRKRLKIKDGRKRSASRARATKILQQGHGEKIQLGEEPTASVVCHKVRYLSGDRTTLPLKFEQEHPGKLTAVVDDN